MTPRSNLLWQFLGHGLSRGFAFLFYLLLPLAIGIEAYGQFAFALAASLIIVQPVIELGLDMVVAKWVARGEQEVFRKGLFLRATAALLAIPLVLTASRLLPVNKIVLLLLFPYFLLGSLQNLVFAFFRGLEDMRRESLTLPLEKCSALGLLFFLPYLGVTGAPLGGAALLGSVLLGTSALLAASTRHLHRAITTVPAGEAPRYSDMLKEGSTLGVIAFLWLLYFRIDSVMLGVMRGDFDVGIYNVAYKLLEGSLFIPSTIMIVFFPTLAKQQRFKEVFGQLLLLLGTLGLGACVALYLASPSLIRTIFGPRFSESAAVLQTLSLALPSVFVGHLTTQSLVALDSTRRYLLVASLGTLLNILLNFLLIPSLGPVGAAWATVATEAFVTLLSGYLLWKTQPDVLTIGSPVAAVKDTFRLFALKIGL